MIKVKRQSFKYGEDAKLDVDFEVTQLGFADSKRLFVRLAKALGPGFAQVAEKAVNLKTLALSGLVQAAVENLSEKDLDEIADLLGTVTRFSVDGGKKKPFLTVDNREALFSGELLLYFEWLWFALGTQYGDFSRALLGQSAADQSAETTSPLATSNS